MKTIGTIAAASILGAGLFAATSASAADGYGYRQGSRTIIHEDYDDDDRPPAYGYRGVGLGETYHAPPRYRTRRVVREIYEFEDDDLDD